MLPQQQQRILGYFIEEAKDHLNTIEQGLLSLQSTLNDPEMLNEVFRAAHSIKGGAAMLGLSSIQHTSHRLEDCFKVLKEHPVKVDQKLESLFLGVSDTLKALLEHLQQPFGLTEQAANDLMSEAEPVFQWLHEHLEELVQQGGRQVSISTVAEEKKTSNQVDTPSTIVSSVNEPAHQSVASLSSQTDTKQQVQAQVIQILREMLQLFKQSATPETRRNLEECCQKLAQLGEELNWLNWSNLCRKAASAIANTENTYLTLAKTVITDIKQSLELVLADKEGEIVISKQLESLIPAPEIELLEIDLVEEPSQITAESLKISDETPLFSTADSLTEEQTVSETKQEEDVLEPAVPAIVIELEPEDCISNLTELSFTFDTDNTEKEDEPLFAGIIGDHNPPEVGRDELNSLADLFEGETPDLEITWEQVEILDMSTGMDLGIDLSNSDTKNTDSEFEFLFEQETNPSSNKTDEQNNELTLVELFGDDFLEQEDSENENQSVPELVIEFSYDNQVAQEKASLVLNNENIEDNKLPIKEVEQQEKKVDKRSNSDNLIVSPKDEISSLDDLFVKNPEEDLALLESEVSSTNLLDTFATTKDHISSIPEDTEYHFWEQQSPQESQQEELSPLIEEDVAKSLDDILNAAAAYDNIFGDITEPISSTEQSLNLEQLDINLQSEEQLNLMFLENADHDLFGELAPTDSEITSNIEHGELYPDVLNLPQQQSNHLQSGNEPTDFSPEALELTPEFTNSVSLLKVESKQPSPVVAEDTAAEHSDNFTIHSPFIAIERDLADELFSTEASSNITFTDEHPFHDREELVDTETINNLQAVFDFTETTAPEIIKQSQDLKQDFHDDLLLEDDEIKAEEELFNNTDNLDTYTQDFSLNEFDESIESLLNLVDAESGSLNFLSEASVSEVAKVVEPENYDSPSNQTTNSEIVENEDAVLSYLEAQADRIEHGEPIDNLDEFAKLDELLNLEIASPKRDVSLPNQEIAALEELLSLIPNQIESENQVQPTVSKGDINDQFKELVEMVKGDLQPRSPANRTPRFEQLMKVPVKHLDDLSNLVGELVVNRNTLEQDQERLRQSLDNLLTQVQQLSDVGTRMQELYERSLLEASLLASRKNYGLGTHAETDRGFSELEMDRFTPFHTLSQEMIELIVRVRESASDIDFVTEETEQVARQFRQVTNQLQEGITRSRMEAFSEVTTPLERGVRESAIKYGKQARLVIEGRDTLIDKMILEHLKSPLTHLLNNAIAHGIEPPEAREALGKPPSGVITVRAFHQGNQTIISVQDDGRGIDSEKVKEKAIKKGIMTAEHVKNMSDVEVYDLLFQAGFTTKDQEDELAGRGVGLDVVLTRISEVRGTVTIDSTLGKGTTFTIRLPLTLSICKALCCVSDKARIAFPMDGVEDTLDIPVRNIQEDANQQKFIPWRDTVLPLRPLKDLLTYNRQLSRGNVYGGNREDDMISVVVVRSANTLIALQIDQVLSEQEIVIKQFEGPAPKPVGVAGATILGDGRIMPIADVLEIVDIFQGRTSKQRGVTLWEQKGSSTFVEAPAVKIDPTVLIVDDSITVRELLSLSFNKAGYRVEQARDGQEAWDKLRSGLPCDIVFCDIEMPRCDGLELLSRIQKDSNLNHLPIAMLTSRGADKHRQMAIQLGASGYFTKPYLEEALLEAAARMLKGEKLVTSVPDKE
ncbi:response regulator [Aetokthonos hydrillicola Thurmond2011]|jgi:chemosensory pili system protein ChpA (sensor histidine kinase/response regulator)|uniref:histidine kinase n=1 Tax=Aetokthonos hydrillicola Thurmond2011 TaxID=2712845 RepID=A0AAP5I7J6_9CYAN|nr:response regulator [Aetokthonos hydrillicola]MBO3457711.1 response regulator [Aetokthonos hydrillicola CCALA 1050]MBW4590887.1 response regulator [Aetokthonos hydrillicola CCALA 1050]MDR9896200.1 response regulator [Aetokthonos hydrillicola Thurmond2011]